MQKPIIKGRKPGDNITLINTMYLKKKDPSNNKWKDCMTIVYKDNDTGTKYKEEIMNPTYEYYIVNEDKRTEYSKAFVSKDDVEAREVPNSNLLKDMCEQSGKLDFFYQNLRSGNPSANRTIHLDPMFMNSDMDIEDNYRFRFDKMYKNEPCNITKSYFDIEADTINMAGDFPEMGECPVNAITLVLEEQRQIYVFLLRNKTNPLIEEFEKDVASGKIFPELNSFIIDALGGQDSARKYKMDFKFKFMFYDEEAEINLIHDLFNAINAFKPDFTLVWNMSFDIPYLIERIKRLGYSPEEIMCPKDFDFKNAEYSIDTRHQNEFAERSDTSYITSYTVYLDQMIQFASKRKGQSRFLSFTLDYIGGVVAKVRKLDYKNITTNLSELPYKDYKTFVFYNIMDTIVQYCIEFKTSDIDYVFNKSIMNNTRYSKVHRQTVYLANRGTKFFYDDGYIIGNNINRFNKKPEEKFPGAFVADPLKVNDYSRVRIRGRAIDVFNNCVDFDYSSLYPSIMREFLIFAYNMIGKIKILEQVYPNENRCKIETWTRAGAFAEDINSQMFIAFCSRWLRVGSYDTLYDDLVEFFTCLSNTTNGLSYYNYDGSINPIIFYDKKKYIQPIIFEDDIMKEVKEEYIPFDIEKMERWRANAIANPNQSF